MVYAMIYIISYVSLMILTMPAKTNGIIEAAILSFAGIILIAWKMPRINKDFSSKNALGASILIAGYLGCVFFNRWWLSSKVRSLAVMLHLTPQILLFLTATGLAVCSSVVIYYMISNVFGLPKEASGKRLLLNNLLCSLTAAIVTVSLAQIMVEVDILSMGVFKFCWGIFIVFIVIMLLYCLSGKIRTSIMLGTLPFMIISTVNVYIFNFRDRLFEPVDIFSFKTAMNVATNYSLWPIPVPTVFAWAIWMGIMFFVFKGCYAKKDALQNKTRLRLAVFCVAGIIAITCYSFNIKTFHWHQEGAVYNGYALDFVSKFKEAYISKPKGYSEKKIDEIAEKYVTDSNDERTPHIIVIMDEAFSDLDVLTDISTDKEVMPFISSLKENVTSGYVLTSVFGGNTANSEYEFLTGNTMAWLSPNVVPYQQYIHSSAYSIVSYLKKNYNYHCVAMHPYLSDGWNRPETYKNFRFDDSLFLEDFPQKNMTREYVSDKEMFEKIIETYENQSERPLFLFGVTMQNHGPYNYTGDDFKQTISLVGYKNDFSDVEQYSSLLYETDKAVEYLLSYFSEADEDVVIVFFGDHQPRMTEEFYDEIGVGNADTLDAQQARYKVPFFIWTNYDSPEQQIECTSLNYLTSHLYKSAGIKLPPYNQFLSEIEEKIPAINVNGFYSLKSKCFLPFEEASDEEKKWLDLYEMLQYNSLFDKEHRNDNLFVTLE